MAAKKSGYLKSLIGLDEATISAFLNDNANATAEAVVTTLNKFIHSIVSNKSGSAGALKGYQAVVNTASGRSINSSNSESIVLPKSGVKLLVPLRYVSIEAPNHHKAIKIKNGGSLHVFNLLDTGRSGLPKKAKGGYALYNVSDNPNVPRTSAGGKSKGRSGNTIRRPVGYDVNPVTGGVSLRYADIPLGSIMTGSGTSVINRPEPRPAKQFKSRAKPTDSRFSLSNIRAMSESNRAALSAVRAERSAYINQLREDKLAKIEANRKPGTEGLIEASKQRAALKRLLKQERIDFVKRKIAPIMLAHAQSLADARAQAKIRAMSAQNKKDGVVYTRGPIRPVPPRNFYKRAVEQTKDRLSGKGFYFFEVIFVRNFGKASKSSRDR